MSNLTTRFEYVQIISQGSGAYPVEELNAYGSRGFRIVTTRTFTIESIPTDSEYTRSQLQAILLMREVALPDLSEDVIAQLQASSPRG